MLKHNQHLFQFLRYRKSATTATFHFHNLRCEWGTPPVDHFDSNELFMNAGKYVPRQRAIVAHSVRRVGDANDGDDDDNNNKKKTKAKLRMQCVISMENEKKKRNQQHKFIE